jgi:hypothetical protein
MIVSWQSVNRTSSIVDVIVRVMDANDRADGTPIRPA